VPGAENRSGINEQQVDDSGKRMILLDGADEPEKLVTSIGGGVMVAYSCRAPDKDTANEDAVAAIPYGPDAVVLVIADGAGGLPAGRRAARMAVRSLEESLHAAISETMLLRTAILNGLDAANQAVLSLANGSATTMTVVTIEGLLARTYQVGDSEAMVVGQRGKIKLQTMPHSPTGFAVEAGFLDKRAALHHEERHLVSNFIGTNDMRIDMGAEVKLKPRDTVLLASDGLTDNIHIHEVAEMIRTGALDDAIDSISSLARRRMSVESKHQPSKPDDLSVILFRKPYKGKEMRTSKPPSG
jgi:serine/threonine protein phosphatase PrpC